jgi:hypothetical protein
MGAMIDEACKIAKNASRRFVYCSCMRVWKSGSTGSDVASARNCWCEHPIHYSSNHGSVKASRQPGVITKINWRKGVEDY